MRCKWTRKTRIRQLLDQNTARRPLRSHPEPRRLAADRAQGVPGGPHPRRPFPCSKKPHRRRPGNELFFMLGNSYLQAHQIPKGRAAFAESVRRAARFRCGPPVHRPHADAAGTRRRSPSRAGSRPGAASRSFPEAHFMLGEIAIYRAQHRARRGRTQPRNRAQSRLRHGLLPPGRRLHAARRLGTRRSPSAARRVARSHL